MTVYHGSTIEVSVPDVKMGRFKLDFGRGFYVTTFLQQAEKWAKRRAKAVRGGPIVSVYEFNVDNLHILSFDGYTEEWLDFIAMNRSGLMAADPYDAIYGNIANDDVATIVNDYIRLLRMGRISPNAKLFYLEQLQYSEPNNQYCIATQKGIDALKFKGSYKSGG